MGIKKKKISSLFAGLVCIVFFQNCGSPMQPNQALTSQSMSQDEQVCSTNKIQDLTGGGSVSLDEVIQNQVSDGQAAAHHAHHGSPGKITDHTSLLNMFPRANGENTNVALRGGLWSNESNWSKGEIPKKDQDVYIPMGISMVYDIQSNENLNRVAVDGQLHFKVDRNTRIKFDTLMTGPGSILTIGTEESPVEKDKRVELIVHRNYGAVRKSSYDPTLLSRGIITHGIVRIHGAEKVNFLKAARHPEAGDDQILFDQPPIGWKAGDKIVVGSTRYRGATSQAGSCDGFPTVDYKGEDPLASPTGRYAYQDETRKIVAIQSNGSEYVVTLDKPLNYDHVPPSISSHHKLQAPVANYTRNILFASESSNYFGNGRSVPVNERGHVMFMHNPDVKVQYAEFFELGRSNKSKWRDDQNVVGRYALHFHRTGAKTSNKPAIAEGNAVWGSPGWGIVHHDAHLDVNHNAVFGAFGSGIVAEAGNETGDWIGNIVIQSTGYLWNFNGQIQASSRCKVEGHSLYRFARYSDPFFQGSGYGLRSRMVKTIDNLAVSVNGAGFQFWSSGLQARGNCNITDSSYLMASTDDFSNENGYNPFLGKQTECASRIPFRNFAGNEVIASSVALATTSEKNPSETNVPTVLEDFRAWEVPDGVISFYQTNYMFTNNLFVGVDADRARGSLRRGVLIRDLSATKIIGSHFENYATGIYNKSHQRGEMVSVFAGNSFARNDIDYDLDVDGAFRTSNFQYHDFSPASSNWASKIPWGELTAQIDHSRSDLDVDSLNSKNRGQFEISVLKRDTFATVSNSSNILNSGPKLLTFSSDSSWKNILSGKGYYQFQGNFFVTLQAVVADRGTGTVGVLPVAIKLSFAQNVSDLENVAGTGLVSLGELPVEFRENQVGKFKIVDRREFGKKLNQLDSSAPTAVDNDPIIINEQITEENDFTTGLEDPDPSDVQDNSAHSEHEEAMDHQHEHEETMDHEHEETMDHGHEDNSMTGDHGGMDDSNIEDANTDQGPMEEVLQEEALESDDHDQHLENEDSIEAPSENGIHCLQEKALKKY